VPRINLTRYKAALIYVTAVLDDTCGNLIQLASPA
jgi:hypothetical protein